jgi:hypothetical protein
MMASEAAYSRSDPENPPHHRHPENFLTVAACSRGRRFAPESVALLQA